MGKRTPQNRRKLIKEDGISEGAIWLHSTQLGWNWQSCVDYSVMCFDCIAAFKASYRRLWLISTSTYKCKRTLSKYAPNKGYALNKRPYPTGRHDCNTQPYEAVDH